MYFGKRPLLRAPAADGDDGSDTTTIDSGDGGEDTVAGGGDRGDEVDPAISAAALKKIAGEDTLAGGEDTVAGGEAGDGGKKGSDHVPIGRFNQVNEAKKALERENAELKAKAAIAPAATPVPTPKPKPVFDEDKAEHEYATFLATGEFDKAVALRKEINANLRQQAKDEAVAESDQRQNLRETTQTLTQVAEQAVKDFPYLDTEDGKDTMELIIAARRGYEAAGMTPPEALKAAVAKIAPKFAPEGQGTPGKELPSGGGKPDSRSQAATVRGADASNRQPERLNAGTGNRTDAAKLDPETMTDEQFNALTPAEKSRLRGDA